MELINKLREFDYRIRTFPVPGWNPVEGVILMLHRVVEAPGEYCQPQLAQLHVTTRRLESLIAGFRAQGFDIISLDGLRDTLASGRKNSRFAVFTFDDAYRDTYELAFPVFRKHNAPFTVYVPTAVPDNDFIWWYYMLEDLLSRRNEIDITVLEDNYHFELLTCEQKSHAYRVIEGLFNGIQPLERKAVLQEFFARHELDPADYARKLSMSWDQIRELGRSGLATIGSHTVNHNNLALLSPAEAAGEMDLGRKRIEAQTGVPVEHFCYPFGCKSAAHIREFDLARKLKFSSCTTSRKGWITGGHRNFMERLPRIMVDESADAALIGC